MAFIPLMGIREKDAINLSGSAVPFSGIIFIKFWTFIFLLLWKKRTQLHFQGVPSLNDGTTCIYMYTYICVHIYTYMCTHIYVRIYMYTYIYTHMYVHIYVWSYWLYPCFLFFISFIFFVLQVKPTIDWIKDL